MISKNVAWTVFAAVAIAIAVLAYAYIFQTDSAVAPTSQAPDFGTGEKNLPEPTGNVDDLTEDLISGAASEQEMVAREDSDKTLIDGDIKIIDEFGQAYNENEL